MKRNSILFLSLIMLVVIFIGVMLTLFCLNRREFDRYERRATAQAIQQHREIELLRNRTSNLEDAVDSIQTLYRHDSIVWDEERTTLKGTLWQQQKQAATFKEAYENTKKAMEKQTLSVPRRGPAVYDLSPVLGDSTDQR